MIYRREEYIEEGGEESKFPVKRIDAMMPVGEGEKRFIGSVTLGLQTPMGVQQLPISFEIDVDTIEDAFAKFDENAEPRIEEARKGIEEEMSRMRREAQSRIVTPGEMGINSASITGQQRGGGIIGV